MIQQFLGLLLLGLCMSVSGWAVEPPVRVRLEKGLESITLNGVDFKISGITDSVRPRLGKSNITISKSKNKDAQSYWTVKFAKTSGVTGSLVRQVAGKKLTVSGNWITQGPIEYPQTLILVDKGMGKFDLVALVPMPQYLVGVLSSEVPLTWPDAALKAQVVAARTYTLSMMEERRRKDFDVEANINDQVFRHIRSFELTKKKFKRARQLVAETENVILTSEKGKVIKAYYHSDCGGETVDAKLVLGVSGGMGTAKDPQCAKRAGREWSLSMDRESIFNKLSAIMQISPLGISKLEPVRLLDSGRIAYLNVHLLGDKKIPVPANEFRRVMGYSSLRSSRFEMDEAQNGELLVFRGRGAGHGVGLCQFGAKALADEGKTAKVILQHYYPRATVQGLL